MRKNTLRYKILRYLHRAGGFVHGGKIEDLAKSVGYKGATAGRVCRKMVEEGYLNRKENNKGHVLYKIKYTPPQIKVELGEDLSDSEIRRLV